jgi:clan AA aspartic protease
VIRGHVFGQQARVNLAFRAPGQPEFQIEYVVDTGFEGALTLSRGAVLALGLPYLTDLTANLADNTSIRTDVHVGTIVWDGAELEVAVLVLEGRPLIGTALLDGHHLEIDFFDGGAVRIETM